MMAFLIKQWQLQQSPARSFSIEEVLIAAKGHGPREVLGGFAFVELLFDGLPQFVLLARVKAANTR